MFEELNEFQVFSAYVFREDWSRCEKSNRQAYDLARRVCEFGTEPDGIKVVVNDVGTWFSERYQVVSNPINLKSSMVALFASKGDLSWGFEVDDDGCIVISRS